MDTSVPRAVIPTLQSGVGVIDDFNSITAYVLRFIIANPGKAFQITDSEQVSLRQIVMQYENAPAMCAEVVAKLIQQVLNRYTCRGYWGDYTVTCTPDIHPDNTYDLEISVLCALSENFQGDKSFNLIGVMEITPDYQFNIKYKGVNDVGI